MGIFTKGKYKLEFLLTSKIEKHKKEQNLPFVFYFIH